MIRVDGKANYLRVKLNKRKIWTSEKLDSTRSRKRSWEIHSELFRKYIYTFVSGIYVAVVISSDSLLNNVVFSLLFLLALPTFILLSIYVLVKLLFVVIPEIWKIQREECTSSKNRKPNRLFIS